MTVEHVSPKKGGAPRKSKDGLTSVLFVRVNQELLDQLDARVEVERAKHPGRSISRADVAREILHEGIKKFEEG